MQHADTSVRKILLLECESAQASPLIESLAQLGEVQIESSMQAALAALSREQFDVFVSASMEFLAPERLALNRQLSAVLDSILRETVVDDVVQDGISAAHPLTIPTPKVIAAQGRRRHEHHAHDHNHAI